MQTSQNPCTTEDVTEVQKVLRAFRDTFAGIHPANVAARIAAFTTVQLVAAVLAFGSFIWVLADAPASESVAT